MAAGRSRASGAGASRAERGGRAANVGRSAGVAAAVAGGLAVGYLAERTLLRPRLAAAPTGEVPLGSLAGELTTVTGPDDLEVVVETYGPPPRRGERQVTLVLSHGWVCTGRVWHEQVRGLADRVRIVTYDQPGHGRSSTPSSRHYDLDLLGDTLQAVLDAAAPSGPLVLVGHSLGGMSLLNLIGRHPDALAGRLAGVVLLSTTSRARLEKLTVGAGISAVARLERGVRRLVPVLRSPRVAELTGRVTTASTDLSHLVTRLLAVGPDADPSVVDFTEQLALDSGPDIVLALAEAVLGVDEDRGLDRLREQQVPTSVVVGEVDRLTPRALSQRMATHAGAELTELPGVGHMAPLEAPERINALLLRHLRRVRDGQVA